MATPKIKIHPIISLLLTLFLVSQPSCYSFKGISIDPNIKTFYVSIFDNLSNDSPPTLGQDFTEVLRDKIRNESRLNLKDTDPDIDFTGSIASFRVSAEAPEPGETTSFNRLTITVAIDYVNNRDEDNKWQRNFSFFANFDANQNLLDVQEQLINTINDQIVEDIFNFAFTDW